MSSAAFAQLAQLIQANALQSYSPPDQTPLPQGLSLPSGYQSVVYAVTTVIAWNPTIVKQKGSPYRRASRPSPTAWKGKFSIDPTAVNWYDALIKIMGHPQALALVQKLGNNNPVLVESHTQALTDVQSGGQARGDRLRLQGILAGEEDPHRAGLPRHRARCRRR